MIEIRDYGDRQSLVVYTDENDIYRKLEQSIKCTKVIPYRQQQNGKLKMVGVDLYFPKKYKSWSFSNGKSQPEPECPMVTKNEVGYHLASHFVLVAITCIASITRE